MGKRHGMVAAWAAATLVLCGWTILSAQQAGTDQIPAFRSGVELVTVDVGVVDRQGRPLRGLGPADFEVTVAGQPRRVATAEFVDVSVAGRGDAAAREPSIVSSNEGAGVGRQFVFIVDQHTLEPGHVRHVAKAASVFFSGLTFVDRSALMLMPTGPNIDFTWAHDRVQAALQRVTGLASPVAAWEFGSLTEARDIASRNPVALRSVAQRECGGSTFASSAGFDPFGASQGGGSTQGPSQAPNPPSGGGSAQGGGDTGGSAPPQGGGQPGGGTAPAPRGGGGGGGGGGGTQGGFRMDGCTRDVQMRAEWAWRSASMTSMASLTSLRQVFDALARVPGDKTVVLISGGWPLDDRDQSALLATLASDAAAARATLFTMFVPTTTSSASRRFVSSTPMSDHQLHSWPLDVLAGMTGGGSYRAEVGAEGAFERLGRELSGYYRIGIEKAVSDGDEKSRRMKVQVSRSGVHVRARGMLDVRTFEDRNWAARLASALDAPIPATSIGLKVTSYLAADDQAGRIRLVLAGEAARLDPGEATFQIVVRDMEGKKVLAGEQPLGEPTGDGLTFSANIPLEPGSYVVRVAVIDGAGRIGSVDHRTDVRPTSIGGLAAAGPLLVRVPPAPGERPRIALNDVRQDERLALQVDLEGDNSRLADAEVVFEIAASADGPVLVGSPASLSPGSRSGSVLAQAVADMRVLPPGDYVIRARIRSGSEPLGEVLRAFSVIEGHRLPVEAAGAGAAPVGYTPGSRPAVRALATVPGFGIDQVLAPQVLGVFLDRVAARPDAASPMIRELVERARSADIRDLFISETLAAEYPVAAFLKGLTLLAQQKLDPAANAFRSAMRASADFYPAMVYLGACYAADGNDKEAAGAWRTALIREGDAPALHLLLGEAFLRQARGDLALETFDAARARWPADDGLKRRFVIAALLAGEYADGLQTLDELVDQQADDEPSLTAGLLVLYEAFVTSRPIESPDQDRARMTRLADAYRVRGGASLALVDTWLAAARLEP